MVNCSRGSDVSRCRQAGDLNFELKEHNWQLWLKDSNDSKDSDVLRLCS